MCCVWVMASKFDVFLIRSKSRFFVMFYCLPNLHKIPYKYISCFIASSCSCTTTEFVFTIHNDENTNVC